MASPAENIYNDVKKQVKRLLKVIGGIIIILILVYIVLVTTQH